MVRVCPHTDAICPNGMNCTFSCATDHYDGTKRPTADKGAAPADGLVERLLARRAFGQFPGESRWYELDLPDEDCVEAATTITRLRAELDEARKTRIRRLALSFARFARPYARDVISGLVVVAATGVLIFAYAVGAVG